jgi:hypothetical protein
MTTDFTKKNEKKYCCEICDFISCKKTDYTRHITTQKHKNNILTTEKTKNDKKYICDFCEKEYNDRVGLWRHKKKCIELEDEINNNKNVITDKELIAILVDEHKKIIQQNSEMLEIIKNGTNNTNNSHNTINNNNKTFNLQFFLNETCKDAMNIMDFVDSIKLQLSDLEKVGEIGYVEGISNIITKNLKALDVTQRPVHCTDKKREVVYIKDENKWEKDDNKKKLRKVIKRVASKNQRLILKFQELHPDCGKASSRFSDQFNKIIVESMGGSGDNDIEKEDKIIRNISKNVTIDKE